jgi:ribose transport system substrate-binding protein
MKIAKTRLATSALAVLAATSLTACGTQTSAVSHTVTSFPGPTRLTTKILNEELAGKTPPIVAQELKNSGKLLKGEVVPGYPNGTTPGNAATYFHFTASDIARLKAGHYTAGIVMHTMGAAWPHLQVEGITNTLKKFGIRVIGVTDAHMDPATQVNNVETMISEHPSVIFSIPVNEITEATAYKSISKAGIKLVFMDNVPVGLTPEKNYVDVVSANDGGNTIFAVKQLLKRVGTHATIGDQTLATDYFSVVVRQNAFEKAVSHYSHLTVIKSTFTSPTQQVYNNTVDMLTAHPNIRGMWLAWDTPAEEAVAAEKALGKHIVITTNDLGPISALDLAEGYISADGAQQPYYQGVAEAESAAYAFLGKKVPPYFEWPTIPVTPLDLIPAYRRVMHTQTVPADIIQALRQRIAKS